MTDRASAVVTILFTDLVGSTDLVSRAGDEEAQRILRAHHGLLADAVAAHGGHEVKWLGDGLMVAFRSAADAVRCAVVMQQASHHPVQGQHLAIRVGLNAGEALRDAADYFGTSVIVARRLCDRAEGGQILCTETVAGLLTGRSEFAFSELGKLPLKGVPEPVAALEVPYEAQAESALRPTVPFVGREGEMRQLSRRLADATAGRGGLVLVAGEPGIGKTRLAEHLAEQAKGQGVLVFGGGCFEGDWAPPYAPFAEAIDVYITTSEAEELRADLGPGAGPLAHLLPKLRAVLPDLSEPVPLQPDEERFRLLDAVAQLLIACSRRAPVLLCLDDLHWADSGTVAMLRHVARLAPRHRILVLGTYRDTDLHRTHPLAEALGTLRRETEYERIRLKGLDIPAVGDLLAAFAEHDLPESVAAVWAEETDGNPFFIRELVRHLYEEGKFCRGPDGRWTTTAPLRQLGIPEGVRDVIGRRLSRLSKETNQLLSAASAFEGPFRFDIVTAVAELGEADGLAALDAALDAQVLQPAGAPETYVFTHALIRHTLYAQLSTSRQVRLHRRVAETLAAAYEGHPSPGQAGEIASQYHRSAGLAPVKRGVEFALAAAVHAETTGGQAEAARFLRMALDLLPEGDPRRPRLLSRLGAALIWALSFDEGLDLAAQAGEAIADAEGPEAAADYLAAAASAMGVAGNNPRAWVLASHGLRYTDDRRDLSWARLIVLDLQRREWEDPLHPGIPQDTPERWEAARILRAADPDPVGFAGLEAPFASRTEVLTTRNITVMADYGGEFTRCLPLAITEAKESAARGQAIRAARCWMTVTFCHVSLGNLREARDALEESERLMALVGVPMFGIIHAREMVAAAVDDEEELEQVAVVFADLPARFVPGQAWAVGPSYAVSARTAARLGRLDEAVRYLKLLAPWLERSPGWAVHFPTMAAYAAETLWLLQRLDHAELIEKALKEKVVSPDFRDMMVDGRLALARLCVLQGRHDEAISWFGDARRVLSEQCARPLLAVCDHDEARMYARLVGPDAAERARQLLESALRQFRALEMAGWIRRVLELSEHLDNHL